MEPLRTLKPLRAPFVFWTLAWRTLIIFVVAVILSIALPMGALLVWILAAFIVIISWFSRTARYKKERYEFYPDRMIVYTGGLFSDNKTELVLSRVTHVKNTLPWIEHKLFRTGTVQIESAGSRGSEATLRHINDSPAIYAYVEEALRNNGFSLSKQTVQLQAKPHRLAVLFSVARSLLTILFILFFIAVQGGVALLSSAARVFMLIIIPALVIALIAVTIFTVLQYLHLSRRTYTVYNDAIVYEEGFLTRRYAFLPAENLADSATTQTLVDRLFDLYDVKISVQGAGSEVTFMNLREGKEVDDAIDKIIDEHSTPISKRETTQKSVTTTAKKEARTTQAPVAATAAGTYKPHTLRALFPLIIAIPLLAVFPLYLAIAAGYLIRAFSLSYEIRSGRVIYHRRFLGTQRIEFTAEKVTEIEFVKGILDRITGTMTAKVKSIGSGENITLFALPDTPEIRQTVLTVDNIKEDTPVTTYPARWTGWGYTIRSLPGIIATVLIAIIGLAIGLVIQQPLYWIGYTLIALLAIILWAAGVFLSRAAYHDATFEIHKEYFRYEYGWLRIKTAYTRYDAVKDLSAKQYWRSTQGDLTVDIAGEETVQQQNQQGAQGLPQSQQFTAAYTDAVWDVQETVFSRLGGRRQPPVLTAKPQARNSVVGMIILFPLIPLIPFQLWSVRKREYRVLPDRVEYERGIMSRTRKSVLYDMVDHVRTNQGLINKIFGNGNVGVYTTGSSNVELQISPIKEYRAVGAAIEQEYK